MATPVEVFLEAQKQGFAMTQSALETYIKLKLLEKAKEFEMEQKKKELEFAKELASYKANSDFQSELYIEMLKGQREADQIRLQKEHERLTHLLEAAGKASGKGDTATVQALLGAARDVYNRIYGNSQSPVVTSPSDPQSTSPITLPQEEPSIPGVSTTPEGIVPNEGGNFVDMFSLFERGAQSKLQEEQDKLDEMKSVGRMRILSNPALDERTKNTYLGVLETLRNPESVKKFLSGLGSDISSYASFGAEEAKIRGKKESKIFDYQLGAFKDAINEINSKVNILGGPGESEFVNQVLSESSENLGKAQGLVGLTEQYPVIRDFLSATGGINLITEGKPIDKGIFMKQIEAFYIPSLAKDMKPLSNTDRDWIAGLGASFSNAALAPRLAKANFWRVFGQKYANEVMLQDLQEAQSSIAPDTNFAEVKSRAAKKGQVALFKWLVEHPITEPKTGNEKIDKENRDINIRIMGTYLSSLIKNSDEVRKYVSSQILMGKGEVDYESAASLWVNFGLSPHNYIKDKNTANAIANGINEYLARIRNR